MLTESNCISGMDQRGLIQAATLNALALAALWYGLTCLDQYLDVLLQSGTRNHFQSPYTIHTIIGLTCIYLLAVANRFLMIRRRGWRIFRPGRRVIKLSLAVALLSPVGWLTAMPFPTGLVLPVLIANHLADTGLLVLLLAATALWPLLSYALVSISLYHDEETRSAGWLLCLYPLVAITSTMLLSGIHYL